MGRMCGKIGQEGVDEYRRRSGLDIEVSWRGRIEGAKYIKLEITPGLWGLGLVCSLMVAGA